MSLQSRLCFSYFITPCLCNPTCVFLLFICRTPTVVHLYVGCAENKYHSRFFGWGAELFVHTTQRYSAGTNNRGSRCNSCRQLTPKPAGAQTTAEGCFFQLFFTVPLDLRCGATTFNRTAVTPGYVLISL